MSGHSLDSDSVSFLYRGLLDFYQFILILVGFETGKENQTI